MNTEAREWLIPLPDIVPLDVRFGTRVVDKDKQGNTSSGGQSEVYVDSMTGWRQYGMDTPPSATVQPRSHVVLSLKMASTSNVGVYVATQVGGGQGDRKLDNSRAATALCEDKSMGIKDYRSSQVDTASKKTEHLRACRHIPCQCYERNGCAPPVLQYVVLCACQLSPRVRDHHAADFGWRNERAQVPPINCVQRNKDRLIRMGQCDREAEIRGCLEGI